MRKLLIAVAAALSAIGGMVTAHAASASVYPPDTTTAVYPPETTVVGGLPPAPSTTIRPPATVATVATTNPVTPTGPPALPTTGGNTAVALQLGAGALVAGTGVMLVVRRRRPAAA